MVLRLISGPVVIITYSGPASPLPFPKVYMTHTSSPLLALYDRQAASVRVVWQTAQIFYYTFLFPPHCLKLSNPSFLHLSNMAERYAEIILEGKTIKSDFVEL